MVDKDRLFLTGGSYAGYLTAWMIGHDQRFKAASAQRGVYDLSTFYGEANAWPLVPEEFGGYPWEPETRKVLDEESPITYVANIHTPFLIIHGSQDFRTGFAQSEMLFRSLKQLNRPVEYVRYPAIGHELTRSGPPLQRMDHMLRIIEFFERYAKNDRPAPAEQKDPAPQRHRDGRGAPVKACAQLLCCWRCAAFAQGRFQPGVKPFLATDAPVIALTHVRVIDGTGAAAREDQTVDRGSREDRGRGSGGEHSRARRRAGDGPRRPHRDSRDSSACTSICSIPAGGGVPMYPEMAYSFPRLYLASGVTTARTAGSVEPYTDLNIKKLIDAGRMPGPKLYITGPYLEGKGTFTPQMHELTGPDDAVRTVNYWADQGVTSFKAYMNITRAELKAAVDAAHQRGIKVTGHLCSIGFREAAAIGIDNLEHGLLVDTEFHPGKQPDVCPPNTRNEVARLDLNTAPVKEMIADLVKHNVAITSTLAVFEAFDGDRPPVEQRFLDAVSPEAAVSYLSCARPRSRRRRFAGARALKKELEFEYAFVKAGGLLISGADPTGNGGALAGFADQRNIELLVEGGFTPVEAIRIATSNGAKFLGELDRFGTVTAGKQADLVVIDGNPAARIADIRNVKLVFKEGAAYDSAETARFRPRPGRSEVRQAWLFFALIHS